MELEINKTYMRENDTLVRIVSKLHNGNFISDSGLEYRPDGTFAHEYGYINIVKRID